MRPSILLASLLASPLLAAPNTAGLKACVAQVFGSSAQQRIVTPSDPTYTDARTGEEIQDDQLPAMIAYISKAEEVAPLIQCAKKAGIKAVPRTGGHHFLAYSALTNTLVIDITHIDYVRVSSDGATAAVGAGIRFGALYTALDKANATWPGGICPTVGLSGFLGAGGFNMQMRQLGLGVDNVLAAKVVKADGCLVEASSSQNPDLWWAIRGGGGGSYGVVVEWTLKLYRYPRSAMALLRWNEPATRLEVASRFFAWAPRADPAFTSQVNVYKNRSEVLGWCLGCSQEKLQGIVAASGLLGVGNATVSITGECNTDNARLVGYVVDGCVADAQAEAVVPYAMNTLQQPFSQIPGAAPFAWDESAQLAGAPTAQPWDRFIRISKSFFVQKTKLLSTDTLRGIISRFDQLDDDSQIWGEWHAWNISARGDASFAWRDQAYAHMEFKINGSPDKKTQAGYVKWMADLEGYLRPKVGPASYSGYMDAAISTPPMESYYGSNVGRLRQIKRKYDPDEFFTNPLAIKPA